MLAGNTLALRRHIHDTRNRSKEEKKLIKLTCFHVEMTTQVAIISIFFLIQND